MPDSNAYSFLLSSSLPYFGALFPVLPAHLSTRLVPPVTPPSFPFFLAAHIVLPPLQLLNACLGALLLLLALHHHQHQRSRLAHQASASASRMQNTHRTPGTLSAARWAPSHTSQFSWRERACQGHADTCDRVLGLAQHKRHRTTRHTRAQGPVPTATLADRRSLNDRNAPVSPRAACSSAGSVERPH
eukprot:1850499-Rhodomonas_salina.2